MQEKSLDLPRRSLQGCWSEQKPQSHLNTSRLENIAESALETKVAWVVDIGIRGRKTTPVEQVEELRSKFQSLCFADPRLLEDAEVLGIEWKCAQIVVSRRRAAQERLRVGVVRPVFGTTDIC